MSVLGLIEFSGIARGIRASDAMVKAAPVELLESHHLDPGKYVAIVTGDVASVDAAVNAGLFDAGPSHIVQSFVLANLHEQIIPAMKGEAPVPECDAVGVLETRTIASIIEAADAACKTSPVSLMRLRLALHIGGKGYAVLVGTVADVEAAVEAGATIAGPALVDHVVIPNPYPETFEHLRSKFEGHAG